MKTIKDIEELVGISRSMIYKLKGDQVFDAMKISIKTNSRGRIVFDEEDVGSLWVIKFYKDMGYTHTQIKEMFNNQDFNKTAALNEQISYLEERVEYYQKLLKVAKGLVEIGVTPVTLRMGMPTEISYNQMLDMLYAMAVPYIEQNDEKADDFFNKEKCKKILYVIEMINNCRKSDKTFDSEEVQKYIEEIHSELSDYISDSISVFKSFVLGFAPDTETAKELDMYFEDELSGFIFNACESYLQSRDITKSSDIIIAETFTKITYLASQNKNPDSIEVQQEVGRLYEYFSAMKFLQKNDIKQAMLSTINLISLNPEITCLGQNTVDIVTLYFKTAIDKFISDVENNGG